MPIRINNLVLDIEDSIEIVKAKAAKKLRISESEIKQFKILKESIDARKKNSIKFTYAVEVSCNNEKKLVNRINDKDIRLEEEKYREEFQLGNKKLNNRPVVIGMGPAGMLAGLLLAKKGYKPLIIERGQKVEERTNSVSQFWSTGNLNLESNVQFGEGGAGTFSDGKLTTRIKDVRCDFVLEEFVKAGAPEEILYSGKPHIGTDILKDVVRNIRNEIIKYGGEVLFNSKLEDIKTYNGHIKSIKANGNDIPCEALIIAIGHSSRDTYKMLLDRGVSMDAKPFAIGVRIEHLQAMIDENQYGKFANHPRLKAADYRLAHSSKHYNRSVYSFCMCPGGEVVAAASEEGRLVTNGMSYFARDMKNANSALVVSVGPEDFGGSSPLSGMEFQRHYEALAYKLGADAGKYHAPVQLVGDFLEDRVSKRIGEITPSYRPGYEFRDLRQCLPKEVIEVLKEGLLDFDRKVNGFAAKDAVLTGIETRTSAPVRMPRGENLQSISVRGLYPAGEGAGYAGGIVSAAVDGLKAAESIMREYSPIL
ncbi:MAG: NAD(P)/FAD-dependent oxidoreductase [Bacillota bacterium]|nr:NAD(P)/FAD-dependent oxidoreductase [Bacillota bacterium]